MKYRIGHLTLSVIIISGILHSCAKDKVPVLSTSEITNITATSAMCGGSITDEGSEIVLTRGVCWSTDNNPTLNDSKTEDGSGDGVFESLITGLDMATTYYVRAYATSSAGTSYGNQLSFTTWTALFDTSLTYGSVTDVDGNTYKTIQIGKQEWMAENLKTTKFNDGTDIPFTPDNDAWLSADSAAYCDYDNDPSNSDHYGRLYNFSVADSTNTRKVCPAGWHVPSSQEWVILVDTLGGEIVAGGKLKEETTIHWATPNAGATNESGFTALPGGLRSSTGSFSNIAFMGLWWTSAKMSASGGLYFGIAFDDAGITDDAHSRSSGLSIRCVKDN